MSPKRLHNDRKCSRNVESGRFCYNLIVYFLKCIRWRWVTAAFIVLHIPFGLFPNMQVFNCALETFKGAQPLSSRSSCTTRSVSRVGTMSSLQSAVTSWSSVSRACAHWEWRAERECFLQSLCLIVYIVPEVWVNYLCYSWDSMSETTWSDPSLILKACSIRPKAGFRWYSGCGSCESVCSCELSLTVLVMWLKLGLMAY